MTRIVAVLTAVLLFLSLHGSLFAGQPAVATANTPVPHLVNFGGVLRGINGQPLTGAVGVTFSLYNATEGGAPLWIETQNVQPDKAGHYSVLLGSTTSEGLPSEFFVSGDARWLGVRVQGQAEQPRVLLVSVPYALKAGDAQTIGGLPPTAFVLAAPANSEGSPAPTSGSRGSANSSALSGSGTADYVPLWTDNNGTLGNSAIFQGGTAKKPKIGIGTTKPASTLDVKGGSTIRGALSLPATGTATAAAGADSQPLDLAASAFNSGTGTAVSQNFQWQAEPVGNNTGSATGSLNLLFAEGGNKLSETGLNIASNGQIAFAPGQVFPGTGTITGVVAGTDLTGGGSSGQVTMNLDTTKVPQLNASNNFTSNQTITGNFSGSSLYALTVNQTSSQGWGVGVVSPGAGVYTSASNGTAVEAVSSAGYGVYGGTNTPGFAGVWGDSENQGAYGVLATNNASTGQALWAETTATGSANGAGPDGVHGVSHSSAGSGVAGINDASGGIAVYGRELASNSYAGRFDGNVWVNGNLSKNGGSFKIDHPLDPANKYLYHSFVESPDMKNIYDGVVTLDASGEAVVEMPEWFGALNRDFRYQLTCIGGFAPVYIAEEIADNKFKISGGRPGMKVSWQITGTRQDAWANAHRIPVEEIKPEDEHGTYLHPELFGAPQESAVGWGRYRFPDNAPAHHLPSRPAFKKFGAHAIPTKTGNAD